MALEKQTLRLTSAKVEVEVELGKFKQKAEKTSDRKPRRILREDQEEFRHKA